jgi:hypothetical protein
LLVRERGAWRGVFEKRREGTGSREVKKEGQRVERTRGRGEERRGQDEGGSGEVKGGGRGVDRE